MDKLKLRLKNFIAHVGNFIRKLWDFPHHMIFFAKKAWHYWIRQVSQLWRYAEVAEYFEVTMISIQLILLSITQGWNKLKRNIIVIGKVRFQLAYAGSGSWIDRQLYCGDWNYEHDK